MHRVRRSVTSMFHDELDHHLVHDAPAPIFMGELPRDYGELPATVVVNLCGVFPPSAPLGMVVFGLPLYDCLDPALAPRREDIEAFLSAVHPIVGKSASYWHCHAGLNRSGIVLAAYLHLYRDMPISAAIRQLRERRSGMVLCNASFERMLRTWYGQAHEQAFEPVPMDRWLAERNGSFQP